MRIFITGNYEELSKKAAEIIANEINEKNNAVLGLATGSTPEGTYAELVKMYNDKKIDFSNITTFNLDEYYGLEDNHEQSYHYFMNKHLMSKVNIKEENINIPSGVSANIEKMAAEYDEKIEKLGGIDIQILGIGVNGHIGFNEPDDKFTAPTHLVDLSQETLDSNARFFDSIEDIPTQAVTMGMGSIMNAKKVLLIASGENKANAIYMALKGPIKPEVPASILQLHNDLIVILDNKAASKL